MGESPPSVAPESLESPRSRLGIVQTATLIASVIFCALFAICYAGRFDSCAAITVFPVWIWLAPGLALTALGMRRGRYRKTALAATLWGVYLLALADEPWSLLRLAIHRDPARLSTATHGVSIRIVSLNCGGGSPSAASEVAGYQPDVVLLQESPNREELDRLARQLFGLEGQVVSGFDASMIVRGEVVPRELSPRLRAYFVQAGVRLTSGAKVEVISTRLVPAVVRFDLWSPDCWREQSENRRKRREQLRTIVRQLDGIREEMPLILGGDFNAPQGDAVFRLLSPRLRDTFAASGRGWGNTIVNEFPFARIDQIWASGAIRPVNVVARPTRHSDHRIVVCDLIVPVPMRGPAAGEPLPLAGRPGYDPGHSPVSHDDSEARP